MAAIDPQRASLGAERFTRFTEAHAKVTAMQYFSVLSVAGIRMADYSDEALNTVVQDASDVVTAAEEYSVTVENLVDMWRAQRQELETP